jgi:hypothetical protein
MALSFLSRFAQDTTVTPEDIQNLPTDVPPEVTEQFTSDLDSYTVVTTNSTADAGLLAGIGLLFLIIYAAILVFYLICAVKIFQKAGRKWWEAIIPIYNAYVMLKIVGRPGWWLLLFFIPLVNIVVSIILSIDLAKAFQKDAAFGVLLLWLLSFIGYPMLAFGSAQYVGPEGSGGSPIDTTGNTPPPPVTPAAPSAPPSGLVQ